MNATSKTSRILLVTMLLAAFAAGCNRQSPGSNQASSGAGTTGTDTATAAGAKSSGISGGNTTPDAPGSSGTSGASGTSDSSGSSATPGSASSGATEGSTASKAATSVGDSVITTKVKSALLADPEVKSTDISVETQKGEVMLSGFVNDQAQIDHALKIARGVEGVKGVQNKLTIKKA